MLKFLLILGGGLLFFAEALVSVMLLLDTHSLDI